MQHVFIVGSKGIPSAYGGFETFVDKLTECHQNNSQIRYHVACKDDKQGDFEYHNAHCFCIKVPKIGSAQAIYYDIAALQWCCKYILKNQIDHPIVYILACRIGPFASYFRKKIHKLGGTVYLNPDGHEWKRAKWSLPVRKYWKISEKMMVRNADLLVCDSQNIERYIVNDYSKYQPRTTFIAYGSETEPSRLSDDDQIYTEWLREKKLIPKEYYLVVGRFVPENNFETMIREFMRSDSRKDFAIITTANHAFLEQLERTLHFQKDKRIKFVGTVYERELLKKIRENAYGYLHGHEVGGTNPSLLEALGSTDLNLLLDVGFNREVGRDAALYWKKESGSLSGLIEKVDQMSAAEISKMGKKAKIRIQDDYSWEYVAGRYEDIFLSKSINGNC